MQLNFGFEKNSSLSLSFNFAEMFAILFEIVCIDVISFEIFLKINKYI